jgi:ABC-type methionine transport system permease subunit
MDGVWKKSDASSQGSAPRRIIQKALISPAMTWGSTVKTLLTRELIRGLVSMGFIGTGDLGILCLL